MRKSILSLSVTAALLVPGFAAAQQPAPSPLTGNITLITDYRFRGISQTFGKPAFQGGFDYANSSGFYASGRVKLYAKGLSTEPARDGVVVKPSLPLRDAIALSKDLAAEGLKVQVRRSGGPASAGFFTGGPRKRGPFAMAAREIMTRSPGIKRIMSSPGACAPRAPARRAPPRAGRRSSAPSASPGPSSAPRRRERGRNGRRGRRRA